MSLNQSTTLSPPLGISDEVVEYLRNLKPDERVIECGQSGLTGCQGTVYLSKTTGDVCVRWDGTGMGSSATWGTRRLVDAGISGANDTADLPATVDSASGKDANAG